MLAFCEANRIPVAASFRCQDYVDNRSDVYAGHLTLGMDAKLAQRVEDADLILALGGRLGEVTTRGYTLLEAPRPRQTLVHAHPDPDELGRVYEPELPIVTALPELGGRARRGSASSTRRAGAAGPRPRAPTTSRASSAASCPATSISAR